MRYVFLTLLIAGSIGVFFMSVLPKYRALAVTRAEVAGYRANLDTAKSLAASREALIATYRSISKDDLDNLKVLLPDSVNNIRLIIQIDSLAKKNGLSVLKGIDYQVTPEKETTQTTEAANKPYGVFTMSFQTSGQYKNFLAFISELEQNLRLVDISSVDFTVIEPSTVQNQPQVLGPMYKVTVKTYWLKQ